MDIEITIRVGTRNTSTNGEVSWSEAQTSGILVTTTGVSNGDMSAACKDAVKLVKQRLDGFRKWKS